MTMLAITIKKLGLSFERDSAKLPPASIDYLLQNGFSQRLRDVHASVKRDDYSNDDAGKNAFELAIKAAVDHALAQIDSGEFEVRASDPVKAAVKQFVAVAATPDEIAAALAFINKQRAKAKAA